MWSNHLPQYMSGHNTGLTPKYFTVSEEDHGRNALDVVGACSIRISIDIHLEDAHLVAHIPGEFLDDRCHHFARSAPIRVKVDEYRLVTLDNIAKSLTPRSLHVAVITCLKEPRHR